MRPSSLSAPATLPAGEVTVTEVSEPLAAVTSTSVETGTSREPWATLTSMAGPVGAGSSPLATLEPVAPPSVLPVASPWRPGAAEPESSELLHAASDRPRTTARAAAAWRRRR